MAAAVRGTGGSPLRHVVVMTTTGSILPMVVFAVDLANLLDISILGVKQLIQVVGWAGAVLFFHILLCIGLTIGAELIEPPARSAPENASGRRGWPGPASSGGGS